MSAHGFCVISQETGLHFYLKPCSVGLLKQSAHFFRNRPAPFLLRRLVKLVASGYFPQYASLVNSLRKLAQRYILPDVSGLHYGKAVLYPVNDYHAASSVSCRKSPVCWSV